LIFIFSLKLQQLFQGPLLSYFLCGVPYILWDNIARGIQISCPHIEKSCTAAYYSDRKLGVSEMVATGRDGAPGDLREPVTIPPREGPRLIDC
jgi:hypothetical protein